jgi:hypothetical protein
VTDSHEMWYDYIIRRYPTFVHFEFAVINNTGRTAVLNFEEVDMLAEPLVY